MPKHQANTTKIFFRKQTAHN